MGVAYRSMFGRFHPPFRSHFLGTGEPGRQTASSPRLLASFHLLSSFCFIFCWKVSRIIHIFEVPVLSLR
ncbi:hypothetical protein Y032_0604g560 [Ancylostoma ceylanicum]|uniref:Uncharacterized protein n=1 Tax=Ancylostoma ceylanicum TaxID=53326 RepID=A0A016WLE8_9BILA|nr:hypothetical protein Y032_0604g560 [Ancylostoma ceylanicum]